MRERHFEQLRTILLDRGVSARYAERLVGELEDHYDDARAERLSAGDATENDLTAAALLGPSNAIVSEVLVRPELRGRCYGVRAAMRPMLTTLGSADGAAWDFARWSASITFGSLVTCALLLAMARTIALGV